MAILYVDTDGSGASSPFSSWATAAQSLEAAIEDAACVAGSIVYMQGATADSTSGSKTITVAGTYELPIRVIGCIDGTTNEGASIVAADLADRITANMPVLAVTAAGNLTCSDGSVYIEFVGIDIQVAGYISTGSDAGIGFIGCDLAMTYLYGIGNPWYFNLIDCAVSCERLLYLVQGGNFYMNGGSVVVSESYMISGVNSFGNALLEGVDMGGCPSATEIYNANAFARLITLVACKLPPSYLTSNNTFNRPGGILRLIGCSDNTSAKASTASYQRLESISKYGGDTISQSEYRTGGADDGASGNYSIALSPRASNSMPGSFVASVKSPWIERWVDGGSEITLTAFVTHDNADTIDRDLYQSELRAEWQVPSASDYANPDITFDPSSPVCCLPTTVAAGDDDTASTWQTNNTYKRSFSITFTPGYSGIARFRVYVAQDSATPVTVYLDGKLELS